MSAVVTRLGHNMSFKGMFGSPRRLVADATQRLCAAAKANKPNKPVRFVLMNTAGNSDRDLNEEISFGQKCVVARLRLLLPPHVDNEKAVDYLRTQVRQSDEEVEWVVIRPDNLIDEPEIPEYEVHPSPIRSAVFDAGVTRRINVACFMAHPSRGQRCVPINTLVEQLDAQERDAFTLTSNSHGIA